MSQANIEIAKNCYAAFVSGNIPAILAVLADDVEWINPGKGVPTEGTRRSVEEVARFFEMVGSTWNFTSFEPREYVANGETVVVVGSYAGTARATGKPFAFQASRPPLRNLTRVSCMACALRRILRLVLSLGQVQ